VIEFLLPKIIEDCIRCCRTERPIQRDASCMGFCAHSTYRSAILPARYCLQMIQKEILATNLSKCWTPAVIMPGERFTESLLKALSEAKYSVWIKSRTGKIFRRSNLSRVL